MFFNIVEGADVQSTATLSRSNTSEAAFCVSLLRLLSNESKKYNCSIGSIGLISPYSEQIQEIKKMIRSKNITLKGANSSVGKYSHFPPFDLEQPSS